MPCNEVPVSLNKTQWHISSKKHLDALIEEKVSLCCINNHTLLYNEKYLKNKSCSSQVHIIYLYQCSQNKQVDRKKKN